jgi:hypothetical protein
MEGITWKRCSWGKRSPARPCLPPAPAPVAASPPLLRLQALPFCSAPSPAAVTASTTSPVASEIYYRQLDLEEEGEQGREAAACDWFDPMGEVKDGGIRRVVVIRERYWVSDVWARGRNGRWKEKNRDKFACPDCCVAITFLGLIYVCVNGPLVIVSVNLCVWRLLTARFMCLGGWKGVDRLASPYRLKT